jgi:hypothetical protein
MRDLAAAGLRPCVVTITVVRSAFGAAAASYSIVCYLDHDVLYLNQDIGVSTVLAQCQ